MYGGFVWSGIILNNTFPIQYYSERFTGSHTVKGKVIADSVLTTTCMALMFTTYCLFSMFYWFM